MATLKDVLSRTDERLNVKNMAICFVTVLVFVSIAFGIFNAKSLFQGGTDKSTKENTVT
ncbi:MAG: hypothetical protein QGI83_10225 [Candidatus Latescibacteria bacterium]|nr:hypothetical protein [Candidatus Latescibacterota bacterium]